jgi:large repetitive protein
MKARHYFSISIFLILFLVIPHSALSKVPSGDIAPLGNPDGQVNVGDALLALRFALNLEPGHPTADELSDGDVAPLDTSNHPNPDGQITVGDALVILRIALSLIVKEEPVEPINNVILPTSRPFPRGSQPSDLVISPDGSRVYASVMGTHNVFVISTEMNAVIAVIDLGEGGFSGVWPFRLSITPDGTNIYVANFFSENISVIDTGSNRVITTIEIGDPVRDIAFTPDSKYAYIDLGATEIAVVDVNVHRVEQTISLEQEDRSFTLAVSPDGRHVYAVSQAGGGRIYIIDVALNAVIEYFDLGKELTNHGHIALSPDGSKLYLPSGITATSYARPHEGVNKVFVVDLEQRSVVSEIEVLGGPIAMALSPDGRKGYVSTFSAKQVFVVDLLTNSVTGQIEWDGVLVKDEEYKRRDLRGLVVAPKVSRLYITGWDADGILVADLTTERMINIIELNKVAFHLYEISISPDGRWVYASAQAVAPGVKSGLFVIDTASNTVLDKIAEEPYPSNPYVTSDGQLLYAVSGNRVLVIDLAANRIIGEIFLGNVGGFPYDIALVPGKNKAYVTNVRSREVYVVNLELKTVLRNIDVGWYPQMVVVTPDGQKAYVSRQNNPYDSGGLAIIDTSTDQVIGTIDPPLGTGTGGRHDLLVVTQNGEHVYWAPENEWLHIISTADDKVLKTIGLASRVETILGNPRGIHPTDVAFTSDGSRAYIPCGDAYYVVIMDVESGTVIDRLVDVGIEPVAVVITPDDGFAYLTTKKSEEIIVLELATNKIVERIFVK